MDMFDRNEKIYELKKTGVTYTEISKMMSISKERARQIYLRLKDKKEMCEFCAPLKKLLSTRMQNTLIICFKDEHIFENPQKIIKNVKLIQLKKVEYIGNKSIKVLVDAMITLGYVKSEDRWLEEWWQLLGSSITKQQKRRMQGICW
jgi:hypothetical protein